MMCQWAACAHPAKTMEDGYLHCARHLREHRALMRGDDDFFLPAGAEREHKPKDYKPCGTAAAYRRHNRRGEPICDLCRVAETDRRRAYKQGRTIEARRRAIQHGLANDEHRLTLVREVQRLSSVGVTGRTIARLLEIDRNRVIDYLRIDLGRVAS